MTTKTTTNNADADLMSIRIFTVELTGISPLSFSRKHDTPKVVENETPEAWEKRTWREKLHYMPDTLECYIPPMGFKNGLSESAKSLNEKIPGKRNSTYTKKFERGVVCDQPAMLGIKRDDFLSEELFVPSDGVRGGGKRVWRTFPVVSTWRATAVFQVLDDVIDEAIFRKVLREFGLFIGLGRFRPQNNGYYGRFKVSSVEIQTTYL
jgi:hypothetical protein